MSNNLLEAPEVSSPVLPAPAELSRRYVFTLVAVCYAIYLALFNYFIPYPVIVAGYGDNPGYIQISAAIRHWDFSGLHPKLFWGLPYLTAMLSKITTLSDLHTLLVVSWVSSFIAIFLAYKLWGGWVASLFAVTSREWIERSLLGGAEPIFMACVFGSFLAARKRRWKTAALLASFATVVRPMGLFALIGVGTALLLKRDFRRLTAAVAIGMTIGGLYVWPLLRYLGNPFANVQGYDQADWNGGIPLGVPLVAIVQDALAGRATKLNLCRTVAWVAAVAVAVILALSRKALRAQLVKVPVEAIFFGLYAVLLFTYNSYWARSQFPRFAIPVLPFVILAFLPWIPKNRALLWTWGIFSAVLTALETVRFSITINAIRRML